ncbi:MAG: 50S ribosomal protein L11 methyltransferase [Firmicutes bacterium]|nr:50S ribosomal protein L11 methyltransferase [Bacillota bacterium]
MKYIEIEIKLKLKPENVEGLLNELSIAGINDAVINNPVEIAEIVSNLGDTEWYDAEQVAEDFVGRATFDKGHYCDTEEMSKGQCDDAPTLATVLLYCTDDEEGYERAELIKRIVARSGETFASGTVPNVKITETLRDDSEWKDAWKEYYHTARVSERFIVKPSWEEIGSDLNEIPVAPGLAGFSQLKEQDCSGEGEIDELGEGELLVIEIDPGMAFGTGTHETTSLSLRLMEKYVNAGDSVLDVGTGSGILAIAAAKLGASDVLGIDIDEDAVRVANENIQNNLASGTVPNVKAVVGDLTEGLDYKADVIVANLLADLVMKLTGSVAKHMKNGAVYITSGILIEKQPQVKACLEENGFRIIEILEDGEWCAVAAQV